MPSSKEYLNFIVGQLSRLEDIAYRAMMGEYLIYYKCKLIGGIYDDRFLVKPVQAAIASMPAASYEVPYPGAKPILLVDHVDDSDSMTGLVKVIYDELPDPKPRRKKS